MVKASLSSTMVGLLAILVPAIAWAQGSRDGDVPSGHRPPPGMCRIWVDGVPPGQQPAPTDCTTALRTRPSNGRVIFGDERREPSSTRGTLLPKKWSGGSKEPAPAPVRVEPRVEPRTEPRREEPKRERVEPRKPEKPDQRKR